MQEINWRLLHVESGKKILELGEGEAVGMSTVIRMSLLAMSSSSKSRFQII